MVIFEEGLHVPLAFRKQKKNVLEDLFSSLFSQFKNYHPSGNLK